MAIKSTIYKVSLQISDLDRHYYQEHQLTLALHPSEQKQRMMVRLLAFARHAHENLSFTRGLSSDEEPELWQKELNGEIALWIELGQVDERRLRKACGRARQVMVYTFQHHAATAWWQQQGGKLARLKGLTVINIADSTAAELALFAEQRVLTLQCTIQDGTLWFTDGERTVEVMPQQGIGH
ncbi:MAG: YaeQ family protein [Mariprofundaceae bacterium]|nr:YaeQ family protein [Mariprofundaceae bacterium]